MAVRLTFLITGFTLLYLALILRLYNVQIQKGDYYKARAETQDLAGASLRATRGEIFALDKAQRPVPVAINRDFPIIFAVPSLIQSPAETAAEVGAILGENRADLLKKLGKKSSFELLAKKTDGATAKKIESLKIKGISVGRRQMRYYPLLGAGSHLVGFVGEDDLSDKLDGKYGLEKFYDKNLSGSSGYTGDINLTIDPSIQKESDRILNELVKKFSAAGGTIIVEDPNTGKILSMASSPGFDPNDYASSKLENFINPAVQQVYEPGSVFKVITMAAGIDAGKITPETAFTDTGRLVLNGKTIQNWDLKAHGRVTMTNVIEESLNTGAAFAQRQTGDEIFKNYVSKFGFGEKTGIDLPGELKGNLNRIFEKNPPAIAFATASFGQGVAVTPIEMANAFAAIANGGKLMRPYVNEAMSPRTVRVVISAETARQVTRMMISAVDKAKVAHINNYSVAGKTGTAQIPERGGYSDRVINTYIGFGPTSDPKFVIFIKLIAPSGAPLAGVTVVPAFRELAQFIINYYAIAPDRLETQ